MTISRRDAVRVSGTTMAGLALGFGADTLLAQAAQAPAAAPPPVPDTIVDATVRTIAPLPLSADGSAPEHPQAAAGPITEPYMWRYTKGQAPAGEYDYRKLKIKVDARGMARRTGTLAFTDLEKLPRASMVTLLQCGNVNPHGIVKWTGVRFSDVAALLGIQPFAHYVRLVAADRYYIDEDIDTMMHRQVMLAWLMNDQPLTPQHGAPIRLVIPFRYGARSIKAITDISLGSTGMPTTPLPS
jgi:DMSO/TMAO reductase YedYZ molybdopterin-dependent catalytic subunit